MNWQLSAKSGPRRGESWAIGDRPILLGRSLGCDVHIDDPTVSRRHCQLYLEGDEVVFRDLGSRNVSLINGTVVAECRLSLGDELSVGASTFILTRTAASVAHPESPQRDDSPSTVSLKRLLPPRIHHDGRITPSYPSSAKDVFRMFQFGRALGKARCEEEFASVCVGELEDVFPEEAHIALWCGGPEALRRYPADLDIPDDITTQVQSVMASGRPSLARYRKKGLLFQDQILACVAPLMVSWRCRGAMLVFTPARRYVLNDRDLNRLAGIAQTAAPYQLWDEAEARQAPASYVEDAGLALASSFEPPKQRNPDSGKHTLITGESGAAASLTARLIHTRSARASGPYVTADCRTISGNAFVRVLAGNAGIGHTGTALHKGSLLGQSDGGTLVLENLEALTEENQDYLAGILRQKSYTPDGGQEPVAFSGLVIATVADAPEVLEGKGLLSPDLMELLSRQQILIRSRMESVGPEASMNEVDLCNTPERRAAAGSAPKRPSEQDSELSALLNAEKTLARAVLSQCDGDIQRAAEIFGVPPETLESLLDGAD